MDLMAIFSFRPLLFILLFVAFIFLLQPKVSLRQDGATLGISTTSFYIPSSKPLKVYVFDPKPDQLEDIIKSNIANHQATFGIYVKNLSTGQEVSVNPNETFPAASLYKLAVMYTIYDLGKKGKLDINKQDIQGNLKAMITTSSNKAAFYLVENYANWKLVTETIQNVGLKDTTLNQIPPITTPKDMAKLLKMITEGKAVDKPSSDAMLDLLASQKINDRIPVLLPPGITVAHKTGELEDVSHDAGVLLGPDNNVILVLMSKDSSAPESVKPTMSQISYEIYEFFRNQWANPPEIL